MALLRRTSFWPPSMVYISVIITHTYYKLQSFSHSHVGQTLLMVPLQGVSLLNGLPWSTNWAEPRFYVVPIKFEFNQLLISIEKFSPLPEFEPETSPVSSRYATNWAILAWIFFLALQLCLASNNSTAQPLVNLQWSSQIMA